MSKNIVLPCRPKMKIWRMRIACWIIKGYKHTLIICNTYCFPLQQWLHERVSILRYSTFPVFCFIYTTDFPLGRPVSPTIRTSPPPALYAWLRDYSCIINSALCDILTVELQKLGVLTILHLARMPSVNLKESGVIVFLYNGYGRVKLRTRYHTDRGYLKIKAWEEFLDIRENEHRMLDETVKDKFCKSLCK